ncbi:hypothetical protein MKW98_021920 [Papaver atlanticum]|uniref:Uncharacterized protein n=1 Tax=Papaver atlanticum TaxID=357466 RepID=A0AAD4XZC2_9MAGN|nr:hypothetical protein MKW98_021920 [Papaver atlanticum]
MYSTAVLEIMDYLEATNFVLFKCSRSCTWNARQFGGITMSANTEFRSNDHHCCSCRATFFDVSLNPRRLHDKIARGCQYSAAITGNQVLE